MRLRLIAGFMLAALPAAAATPPVYVWIHPTKTDLYAMTMLVTTRQHLAADFDKITGVRTGYQQAPVNDSTMTAIVKMLRQAASRGPCAPTPDDPPYTITLYDTTRSGKARVRKETIHASLETIRCRAREALAVAGDPDRVPLAWTLRTLSSFGPGRPAPRENLPVLTGSMLYFQRMQERDRLIADARAFRTDRNWDRVTFDVWTARAQGGKGVRLATVDPRALADDPMAPTWIRVNASTLRAVIEHFLGRPNIEIASHFPREQAMRNGVSGYVAASETKANANLPEPVFAADLLPDDADKLAREVAGFLNWRDPGAAGRMRTALELDKAKQAPMPIPSYDGPAPLAIWIAPTAGEDLAPGVLIAGVETSGRPYRFTGGRSIDVDVELFWRANQKTMNAAARERGVAAALLEAAKIEPTPCDARPQYAQWPETWRVRVYDSATDTTAHLAREFTVSTRAVRCRALAAYDALGRKGDPAARSMYEQLAKLGVEELATNYGQDPAPQRQAPDDARARLLALAQGPPLHAPLRVSFWYDPAKFGPTAARYVFSGTKFVSQRRQDADLLPLDDASMRALLIEALSKPAVAAGARLSRATFVPKVTHAEFRVFEEYGGYPRLVLIAYLTREEGVALASDLARTLEKRDAGASAEMRRMFTVMQGRSYGD